MAASIYIFSICKPSETALNWKQAGIKGELNIHKPFQHTFVLNIKHMNSALNSINSALDIIRNAKSKLQGVRPTGEVSEYTGVVSEYIGESLYEQGNSFENYSTSPEGAELLSREAAISGLLNSPNYQNIFVARVQYNMGEGDPMELFSEYMPNRAALGGDDLIAYDAQLHRILQHMNNTTILDDGLTADPSLKFIMAANLTEALGHSPGLVDRVLRDINRGWHVTMDGSHINGYNGLYNWWEPPFRSDRAKITLKLEEVLLDFEDQPGRMNTLVHEVAHSIDRYRRGDTDGVPTYMNREDIPTLVSARNELFAAHAADGSLNGLREYSYENNSEFWADISTYFLSGEESAERIFNNSPELYGVLSRFYEKDYLFENEITPHSPELIRDDFI